MSTALNFPIPEVRSAITNALADAVEVIKQESIQRTPKETGELRNDCSTAVNGLEAVVYYSLPYAAKQHEEVGYDHQDGEAKFLENAVIATKPVVAAVIAEGLRRQLG
jgi:hypothetical protein